MRATRGILTGVVACVGTIIAGLYFLHAQETSTPSFFLSVSNVSNGQINFVLQNTLPGSNYTLLSESALGGSWNSIGTVTGASNQTWTAMSAPMSGSSAFFQAMMTAGQAADTNLWLVLPPDALAAPGFLTLIITNTIEDQPYIVETNFNLADSSLWNMEQQFNGAVGNSTTVQVPMNGPTLYVRAAFGGDSTGNGIPDWWLLKYFGTTDVDVNALDSANDGWTIYQKFQMGLNPNVFYTPAAPPNLTVAYNANNNTAIISWQPSAGSVTGYTVTRNNNGDTTTFNFPSDTTSFPDTTQPQTPDLSAWWIGPVSYNPTYQVQAQYTGSHVSASSAPVNLLSAQTAVSVSLAPGGQDTENLVLSGIPQTAATIRVTRMGPWDQSGNPQSDTSATVFEIPVSSLTNGIYPLALSQAVPPDGYAYTWWAQAIPANGSPSAATGPNLTYSWLSPFYDGRVQLKQNLIFQLRAGLVDFPFQYTEYTTDGSRYFYPSPGNYAYADIYHAQPGSDVLLPFEENYLYRNFVFSLADVDSNGRINTGVGDSYLITGTSGLILQDPPAYQFQPPTTNWTTWPALLGTNQTHWLCAYPIDSPDWEEMGVTFNVNPQSFSMAGDARNIFGLPFLSAGIAWGNTGGATTTLSAGGNTTQNGYFYPETAQPQFQTVEYDFWLPWPDTLPGMAGFSPTNASRLIITAVGSDNFVVAGYAKLAVLNGYSGVYAYLGQYFDQAYQIDNNGNVTTNTTGVLSPYGDFFATQPGPAALVTMPDPDTGQRGTGIVYTIGTVIDRNQGSNMDVSFSGPNATSQANPAQIWANNNYDRFTLDKDDQAFYDDDVAVGSQASTCPYTPNVPTPDCNYLDGAGDRVIPCERDLQDFFRLWVCGITSNLLTALPAGSTITLNWGDVGSPNSGNPTIDIFTAADPDGGIGYLTNSTIASEQVDSLYCPYIGRLAPGGSIQLNAATFANHWAGNHFIMCGVSNGTGGLNLTIADGNGNVLAQSTAYLQVEDIKQMYERWTIGDQPSRAPMTNAVLASDSLPAFMMPFQYTPPQDTNTPYILFVHGWNMEPWEKDRFAESAFKRLYWQGYHGRFGLFRWPTDYDFNGTLMDAILQPHNYDGSEFNAWESAVGLENKLKDLNAEYPGHVYMLAHSMGNVVAGEALRLAAQNGDGQLVNTYVASQAAIPAHVYDASVTSPYLIDYTYAAHGILGPGAPHTPNVYGNRLTNTVAAAGTRISRYNVNDYALAADSWCFDQEHKPDSFINGYYTYNGSTNDPPPWNHFEYVRYLGISTNLDIVNIPENLYEALAYAANPYSTALGATPVATLSGSIDMTDPNNHIWPADTSGHNYSDHFWHSAQFRGDCWQEWGYWNTLLFSSQSGFNISNP